MTSITMQGKPLKTNSALPAVGHPAPNFTVTKTDLTEAGSKDFIGKRVILSMFPSVDTGTCAIAMKRFNELANKLKNTTVLCISADLPFAQKRFCAAENLQNVIPVSVFRHPEFGIKFGVTISEGPLQGLLSRAIVIVDETGKVMYTQQVKELSEEPDYDAALSALK